MTVSVPGECLHCLLVDVINDWVETTGQGRGEAAFPHVVDALAQMVAYGKTHQDRVGMLDLIEETLPVLMSGHYEKRIYGGSPAGTDACH